MMLIKSIVILLGAYLVGSIPTGYVVGRLCGVSDIRQHGSGTIGATNVARILGKKFFPIIFLADVLKAAGYMALVSYLGISQPVFLSAACMLVLGNIYSIFLGGDGGKGVATSIGVFAVVQPLLIPMTVLPFISVLIITHTVGTASVVGLCALPLCACLVSTSAVTVCASVIALLSLYAHRAHVMRLLGK